MVELEVQVAKKKLENPIAGNKNSAVACQRIGGV